MGEQRGWNTGHGEDTVIKTTEKPTEWVDGKPVPGAYEPGASPSLNTWSRSNENGSGDVNVQALNSDGDPKGPPIRVSTETLKIYAGNLRKMEEPLKTVSKKLHAVNVEPGYFYEAGELLKRIQEPGSPGAAAASGGIATITAAFVDKVINALEQTADDLEKLAKDYDTAEELNGASAQALADRFAMAQGYISSVVNGGGA